jgi:signal peptidase
VKIFTRLALAILILIIIVLGLIHFVPGYDILFVRSESMVPSINLGDVVVTGPINGFLSGELQTGKVIVYEMGKNRITHRILSISGDTIIAKGDALNNPDPWPVSLSQVKGIVFFHIPYLGYVTGFIRTRNGWFLAIILPAALLVLWIVKDIIKESFRNS